MSPWVKLARVPTANFHTGQSSKGRRCETVPGSFFFPTLSDFFGRDQDAEEEPKTRLVLNVRGSMAAVDLSQAWYNMLTRKRACSGTPRQETPVWLLVYTTGLDAQSRCSWIRLEPYSWALFLGAVQNITGILRQRLLTRWMYDWHVWLGIKIHHSCIFNEVWVAVQDNIRFVCLSVSLTWALQIGSVPLEGEKSRGSLGWIFGYFGYASNRNMHRCNLTTSPEKGISRHQRQQETTFCNRCEEHLAEGQWTWCDGCSWLQTRTKS